MNCEDLDDVDISLHIILVFQHGLYNSFCPLFDIKNQFLKDVIIEFESAAGW